MKKYLISLCILLISQFSFGQIEESWKELLVNDRAAAVEYFVKNEPKNIEELISKQIFNTSNGLLNQDPTFIDNLLKYEDFEFYIYALWNEIFFFNDYITTGFYNQTRTSLDQILSKADHIKTPTILYALQYLKAIQLREQDDLPGYFEYIAKIPAIRKWQFCGVFENLNQSGHDIKYPPETRAISSTNFDANSNGFINWYTPLGMERENYQFFNNHYEYGTGVQYAQTFITSQKDQRVNLKTGSSSATKIWLNDNLIYENFRDVVTDLDARTVQFTLPKGVNRLLIKNSESNDLASFTARITDVSGEPITGLIIDSKYAEYNKNNPANLQVKNIEHPVESYFLNQIEKTPTNYIAKVCLISTYLRNSKYDPAKELIQQLLKEFPKSSLLNMLLKASYLQEDNLDKAIEIENNIILNDPDFYISQLLELQDNGKMSSMSLKALKQKLDQFSNTTDHVILKSGLNLVYHLRTGELEEFRKNLDSLISMTKDWLYMQRTYAPFYSYILKDEKKTIEILESVNKKYLDIGILNALISKYEKLDQKDKVIKQLKRVTTSFPNDNQLILQLAQKLVNYKKYDEALIYCHKALEQFPYSPTAYRIKGDALFQLGRKDEAIKAFKESLKRNSNNSYVRKKIEDLTEQQDLIELYTQKDIYQYIGENRDIIKINNYGYNILFDNVIILLHPEGGNKSKYTFVYEITSDDGVNNFKEYNLNLSGSYKFLKSEIVKKDKKIIPADKSGSNLVFKGLEIGDVILVEYESNSTRSGRFYKDFVDYYQFDSFHPSVNTKYTIIVPENLNIYHKVENGALEYHKEMQGSSKVHSWSLGQNSGIPRQESYMPNNIDVTRYLHISTLDSWTNIAHWYSDLVRSQKDDNDIVKNAFTEIFPKGFTELNEENRAKKIYQYLMNNLNYSSVSFRQSGFIPQKPSKTINTKLGDCKDFSTLYVTLAEKASLTANLVLVLTNDNGQNSIVLPSQDFNHCIVKVQLDGNEQFLELTDKFLPFKSLPNSLVNASALEIPNVIDNNQKYNLFKIRKEESIPSKLTKKVTVFIHSDKLELKLSNTLSGAINSSYASIFDSPNYGSIKSDIYDDLNDQIKDNFTLDSLYNIDANKNNSVLKFDADITIRQGLNQMGSIAITQLPRLSVIFEKSIINLEKRAFPIEYTQYEYVDHYQIEYDLIIDDAKTFVEIPKNQKFDFNKLDYSIEYKLSKKNKLNVKIVANTNNSANISPTDYQKFKIFVEDIIKAENAYIGFK